MPESPNHSVELPIYEWHILLKELEYLMSICNRDRTQTIAIYEQIASSLAGYPIKVENKQ